MSALHVMLDLETMGTGPTAAIVQIGACFFDPGAPMGPAINFERTVALQSSLLAGCTIDDETIAWWRRQSNGARAAIEHDAASLGEALADFAEWFPAGAHLWSHGAAFDVPVLEHAYRCLGRSAPWDFRGVRDTRTLFAIAIEKGWAKLKRETAHTALADAIAQAEDVRVACSYLGIGVPA